MSMGAPRTVWQLLAELYQPNHRHATPGELGKAIDPRTIQTPALDLIDRALVKLANTPDGRLIISMPPQEGKSTRVGRDLPIWLLVAMEPDL